MNLKELQYKISSKENLSGNLEKIYGAGNKTNRMLGNQNKHLGSLKSNIKSAASELPFLSNSMGLLANPITLTAGAVGLLGTALNKAKNEAAAFNTEFRQLHNLNLDKSPFGISGIKQGVFNTAYSKGFDASKTSTAFYDVQSIAGIQGLDARRLIEKTGMFSRVMQSDFNQTISGTAQVMDIYGLSVNRADDYLSSMYKTVMVGKTTFDEMSRVQVEYASAASAAGQSYDNANKVFAAFSKTSKSVDIAATLTKTAFQDLTKKSTLQGMKKLGVDVFDVQGNMRGVDEILQQLVPKLKTMSEERFAVLKEEIGGSEGIKGMLDLAKSKADGLLESFELFNSSDMDYGKALRAFHEDVNELNKTLENKTKVLLSEIGQDLIPFWNSLQQQKIDFLDGVRNVTSGDVKWYDQMAVSAPFIWNPYKNMFGSQDRIEAVERSRIANEFSANLYDEISLNNPSIKGITADVFSNRLKELGKLNQWYDPAGPNNNLYTKENMLAARDVITKITNEFISDYNNRNLLGLIDNPDSNDVGTISGSGSAAINKIGSGGSKTINITMENKIDINSTGVEGTAEDLSTTIEENLVRILQGVEEAYAG